MRNAAQRELVCSSWGCMCLCVCVFVDGLECLCHRVSQTFAYEGCPKIDRHQSTEPLFVRKKKADCAVKVQKVIVLVL